MKLEEAKQILKQIYQKTSFEDSATRIALETILKALEDSISKEKIKELLENEKEIYMRNEDEKVVKELDYISKKILGEVGEN